MRSTRTARKRAKRLFGFCLSDGLLDAGRLRQAARDIAGGGSRLRLPILGELLRLARLYEAEHTATIQSATPLPPELRAEFEATLKRRYGPSLAATFSEQPGLIGGVRIQVGSDLYDASVRARLAALGKNF